ncbi:MAG: RsiV family protein [Pseudomonadota bacterium]
MRIAYLTAFMLAFMTAPLGAETITEQRGSTAVELELADLAAHPGFAAFLRDDAMAIADDYAAENARSVRVIDRITRTDGRFASVLRRSEADLGKPVANIYVEALVWDGNAEDLIRLDAFFDVGEPRDEALILISRHLRQMIGARVWGGKVDIAYVPLVEQATNPDPAVMANFTLEPGGLAFHYSPFEIAPLKAGQVSILVPKDIFAPWLNETGRRALR